MLARPLAGHLPGPGWLAAPGGRHPLGPGRGGTAPRAGVRSDAGRRHPRQPPRRAGGRTRDDVGVHRRPAGRSRPRVGGDGAPLADPGRAVVGGRRGPDRRPTPRSVTSGWARSASSPVLLVVAVLARRRRSGRGPVVAGVGHGRRRGACCSVVPHLSGAAVAVGPARGGRSRAVAGLGDRRGHGARRARRRPGRRGAGRPAAARGRPPRPRGPALAGADGGRRPHRGAPAGRRSTPCGRLPGSSGRRRDAPRRSTPVEAGGLRVEVRRERRRASVSMRSSTDDRHAGTGCRCVRLGSAPCTSTSAPPASTSRIGPSSWASSTARRTPSTTRAPTTTSTPSWRKAEQLVADGADFLDVGGVKAGPGDEVTEAGGARAGRARGRGAGGPVRRAALGRHLAGVGGRGLLRRRCRGRQRHQRVRRPRLPAGVRRRRSVGGGHPHPPAAPRARPRSAVRRRRRRRSATSWPTGPARPVRPASRPSGSWSTPASTSARPSRSRSSCCGPPTAWPSSATRCSSPRPTSGSSGTCSTSTGPRPATARWRRTPSASPSAVASCGPTTCATAAGSPTSWRRCWRAA